nr:ribonuclease H-like domain-containing protein [Tanacetum cinerariifolium]
VIQNGNTLKRTGRDSDGGLIFLPPTTAKEHLAVQRESKARTTLLQSIPDDHIANFHYMDDARDIWNAVKARFGGNAEPKKMRKSMLKQEFSKFIISKAEGLHKGYDRMQKILSQLNQLKAKPGQMLKKLILDIKGYNTFSSSQSAGPSHSEFVSATSTNKKISYRDSSTHSSTTTYYVPSNSKHGSYKTDLEQIEKLDLKEMDLKWQMSMLLVRVHKFEQKARRKINFDKKESARFNKQTVRYFKCQQEAILPGNAGQKEEMTSKDIPHSRLRRLERRKKIQKSWSLLIHWLIRQIMMEANTTGADGEFALIGVTSEVAKTDSMKVVPLPLTGDYTSLSDHTNMDESKMPYGTKPSISYDPECVPNDVVSCNDNDKKYASSVSKLCFVCGSGTHLIKDFLIGKPKVTPVPTSKPKVTPVSSSKRKVNLVPTDKPKVTSVPTGKPQVSTPVPMVGQIGLFQFLLREDILHQDRWEIAVKPSSETPFLAIEYEGIFDSGCSRSMTSNKERLDDFYAFHGGKVTFRGGEGRITGKGTIRTPTLDFENVYYVKELHQFNLFSISQISDKKNQVLFTDTECLVLSKDFQLPDDSMVVLKDFQLPDDSMVVLKVPRKHNLYTINLNDLYPRGNLACLVAHASFDESVKWHRWMAHMNYKNMNRL